MKRDDEPIVLQINLKLPGSIWPWVAVAVVATVFNLFAWGVLNIHVDNPFGGFHV